MESSRLSAQLCNRTLGLDVAPDPPQQTRPGVLGDSPAIKPVESPDQRLLSRGRAHDLKYHSVILFGQWFADMIRATVSRSSLSQNSSKPSSTKMSSAVSYSG